MTSPATVRVGQQGVRHVLYCWLRMKHTQCNWRIVNRLSEQLFLFPLSPYNRPRIYNQDKTARIPLVVTYHPNLPSLKLTTNQHHSILNTSERLRKAFPSFPLIAFRRPKNLKDLLVRASLKPPSYNKPGNRPCGAARCKTCPILLATDEFSSHVTGEKFKVKFNASCKSSSVVYLITCRRCGQQYVGETGQPLHCRINGHRYAIAHRRTDDSPVAEHFCNGSHSLADMVVMIVDFVYSRDPCLRKLRESRLIRTLKTSFPLGMNLKVDSLWRL